MKEGSGANSRSAGRVPSHQPLELAAPNITPQAAFNDEQPPNRGDGRKEAKLAIGMQVGRRIDLRARAHHPQHLHLPKRQAQSQD